MVTNFCQILDEAAAEIPTKPLFVFPETRWRPGESLTYGELAMRTGAARRVLREQSRQGDRALLLLPTGAAFWEAFLGCLAAGVVAVPLHVPNLNRSSELLAAVCRDCRPSLLMTDEPTAALICRRAERHPELRSIPLLTPDAWRGETAALTIDRSDADATAFLQYTSGSTSRLRQIISAAPAAASSSARLHSPPGR